MTNLRDLQLQDGEQLLSQENELIFRQVTKHMFHGKELSTMAFGPASADKGMPSYSRSSIVTAQESRDWHTQKANSPSLGVWAVTTGEVIASGLNAIDDSQTPLPPDQTERAPGHCFVDFRELSKPLQREYRARLYFHATERGEMPTDATIEDGRLF